MSSSQGQSIFPGNWQDTTLGSVSELINGDRGKNYPGRKSLSAEGIPFVNAGNLEGGVISHERLGYIPKSTFQLLRSGKFAVGDILYCIRGSLGKLALNTSLKEGAIASSLIIVRPDVEVLAKYVFYYLMSPLARRMIIKFDNGTAQPNLSGADLSKFEIPLCGPKTQEKVVGKIDEVFSSLDKAVENMTTARMQLGAYRQALLARAFEGKLTADWRSRERDLLSAQEIRGGLSAARAAQYQHLVAATKQAFDNRTSAQQTPARLRKLDEITRLDLDVLAGLPKLPDMWAWEKLGWMTCGVDYGTAAKSAEQGQMPVLRMGNLQGGAIDWNDLVYSDDPYENTHYALKPGDVLFNRTNSPELVGKSAIYRGERPSIFAGYLIRKNHNQNLVDSEYLNLFLNSPVAKHYGSVVKTDGVNQSNINGEKLQGYPFPYCSIREQREVVRILRDKLAIHESLLVDIDRELGRALALQQSVLQMAFSGKLVAPVVDDEPVAALLDRIRCRIGKGTSRARRNRNRKEAA
jgi:type I restriction enzyme S subunit